MAWYLTQSLERVAADEANNRSLYRTRVYLNWNQWQQYSGYSTSGGGSVGGQGFSFTGPSAGGSTSAGSQEIYVGDFWIGHDANGYLGGVGADSWFNGGGGYAPGYISASASAGGADYWRGPATPSPTATLNADKTITVTFPAVSSPAGTPTYYVAFSQDGGPYQNQQSGTGTSFTFSNLQAGANFVFRAYAVNSDGTGGTGYTGSVFVPPGFWVNTAGGVIPAKSVQVKTAGGLVTVKAIQVLTANGLVNAK